MLSIFFPKWEIADIYFAISKTIEHLDQAVEAGGFAGALASLKRLGRNVRETETLHNHIVQVTLPLPKYDFDVLMSQSSGNRPTVMIVGGPRYAGFSFTCALPPGTFLASLEPDPTLGVSWRARLLHSEISKDAAAASRP